ncbi:MAG: aldo/keto reductase [Oscillospiraceae bacterium]|jgi:predicted aldo/keto reductase-like oxidoreductase|nr:aldo/keto reductase [Oscillospiraceae bacterium]
MGVFDNYFPMGLGTGRFPIIGPDDSEGVEKSAQLTIKALEAGVNYIDTAYAYSAGMSNAALKLAFSGTKKTADVTVKVMHDMDKTADEARKRAEMQITSLGLEKAKFFVCWTIPTYEAFQDIMRKDGVYDGALKLKNEGLIEHICCSLHASVEDSIKIIKSDAFKGVTISYSLLNAMQITPVLDAALEHNVDVAVMNPLGGGIIAQNLNFFSFAAGENENTVIAALRFAKAHPAVKILLSGLSNESELNENLIAFTEKAKESNDERTVRVMKEIKGIDNFCVNCNYCENCPKGIPVAELMNKRNTLLFAPTERYNRIAPELLRNISLFYSHSHLGTAEWFPDSPNNPCNRCGKCEKICTQKLNIIDAIDDMYDRAGKVCYTLESRKERVGELLADKGYKKVGLYPNGGFANMVVDLYNRYWGEPEFEWLQFNSDPKMWGEKMGGLPIHSPEDINKLKPDVIIIPTYRHDKAIYEGLKHHEETGIKIIKLHRDTDVPWVF